MMLFTNHLRPIVDAVEHELDACVCGPRMTVAFTPDGDITRTFTHHPLNPRREAGMSEHKQCEDCGKCRVTENEDWCHQCEYHSCERGPDCTDTHNLYGSQT